MVIYSRNTLWVQLDKKKYPKDREAVIEAMLSQYSMSAIR